MHTFLHKIQVIGVRPSLSSAALAPSPSARLEALPIRVPLAPTAQRSLPLASTLLVVVPVFLQAPWVRLHPVSAVAFTGLLLSAGLMLALRGPQRWREFGVLLVGFSGCWLGGCLFWGWFRPHPVWHLPIEAFALPLALTGLRGRWAAGAAFYLASLLGTACTDAAMALTGVMPHWPAVVGAPIGEAAALLQAAAQQVLRPGALLVVMSVALGLWKLSLTLSARGALGRIAAAALLTTLVVDGLFLVAALIGPRWSGLI